MARLRYNGLSTTLGASLTSSGVSVTFGAALTHSNGTNVPTITGSDYIPLAILDTSGHLSEIVWLTAYTAAATTGTITRGQEGTTGVAHSSGDKVIHGPTVRDANIGVLTSASYDPATILDASATSTVSDVDATNLAVTFITPDSGTVLVTLSGLLTTPGTSAIYWWLREGTTLIAKRHVGNVTSAVTLPGSATFKVSGLTPGSSHTYKWSHSTDSGTGHTYAGGGTVANAAGPAVMTVYAHP
jgi:hypothetical protein